MSAPTTRSTRVGVWDPLVRLGHWILVAAFAIAYVTEGEPIGLHSWAGYAIAITVLTRILWGIVGPRRARFADFVAGQIGSVVETVSTSMAATATRRKMK